jgi:hypothetical protein
MYILASQVKSVSGAPSHSDGGRGGGRVLFRGCKLFNSESELFGYQKASEITSDTGIPSDMYCNSLG